MKKHNFVLDIEAARNFPSNVDVTYSWGRPDYKYTQYVHRSGVLLAQITDDGNFLLLANRLYNNRTAVAREQARMEQVSDRGARMASSSGGYAHGIPSDRVTPMSSPAIRPQTGIIGSPIIRASADVLGPSLAGSKVALVTNPESIKNDLECFCSSASQLETFYKEVLEKATPPPSATPILLSNLGPLRTVSEANIPALGLPPGVLAREASPSSMRLSGVLSAGSGAGSPAPVRKGSEHSSDAGMAFEELFGSNCG